MDANNVLHLGNLIHVYGHEKYKSELVEFLSKNICVFQQKNKSVFASLSNSGSPVYMSFKTEKQAGDFYEFLVKIKEDATQ